MIETSDSRQAGTPPGSITVAAIDALVEVAAGAIARYEEAIRREPAFAMAHNNLANALAESGRLAEAIPHYETALRLEPDSAEGHNNFASALAQSGRFTDALQHYEIALRLRPDYPQAQENLGRVYLALGDQASAQRLARNSSAIRRFK